MCSLMKDSYINIKAIAEAKGLKSIIGQSKWKKSDTKWKILPTL